MRDPCFYCSIREASPDWDPYCSATCCINAGEDRFDRRMVPLRENVVLQNQARRCWRKIPHETRELAVTHLNALVSRGLHGDMATLRVYRCRHCDAWHVGHASNAKGGR